ncbi:MAG: site-2 protease family protein [Proteobacteria bacterium]|nr:site-2 protease family protein [Pseudomonadota bacterium]
MNPTLFQALTLVLPLVCAIVFHEVAHGWMARALGDPTAAELKRLSLNPLRHVDPVGTLLIPGLLAMAHLPVFGWAKPVPVNTRRLRHPRRDMALVGAAGPMMNLAMGLAAAVAIGLLARWLGPGHRPGLGTSFVMANLANFLTVNLSLALFNLLPIPPFDGSHVVEGLLPAPLAAIYARFRRAGMLIPILLIVVVPRLFPGFDPVAMLIDPPIDWLLERYLALATAIAAP